MDHKTIDVNIYGQDCRLALDTVESIRNRADIHETVKFRLLKLLANGKDILMFSKDDTDLAVNCKNHFERTKASVIETMTDEQWNDYFNRIKDNNDSPYIVIAGLYDEVEEELAGKRESEYLKDTYKLNKEACAVILRNYTSRNLTYQFDMFFKSFIELSNHGAFDSDFGWVSLENDFYIRTFGDMYEKTVESYGLKMVEEPQLWHNWYDGMMPLLALIIEDQGMPKKVKESIFGPIGEDYDYYYYIKKAHELLEK